MPVDEYLGLLHTHPGNPLRGHGELAIADLTRLLQRAAERGLHTAYGVRFRVALRSLDIVPLRVAFTDSRGVGQSLSSGFGTASVVVAIALPATVSLGEVVVNTSLTEEAVFDALYDLHSSFGGGYRAGLIEHVFRVLERTLFEYSGSLRFSEFRDRFSPSISHFLERVIEPHSLVLQTHPYIGRIGYTYDIRDRLFLFTATLHSVSARNRGVVRDVNIDYQLTWQGGDESLRRQSLEVVWSAYAQHTDALMLAPIELEPIPPPAPTLPPVKGQRIIKVGQKPTSQTPTPRKARTPKLGKR